MAGTMRWRAAGRARQALAAMVLAAAALAAGPANAQDKALESAEPECELNHLSSEPLAKLIAENGFSFAGYDQLCASLRDAKMGVAVIESHGTVADRSYGMVVVTLFDQATQVEGQENAVSTTLDESLEAEAADIALLSAFNSSLEFIARDADAYIAGVQAEIARLRAVAAAPVPPLQLSNAPDEPCLTNYTTSDELIALFDSWGDFEVPGMDGLCRRLDAENAGLKIAEFSGELSGRPYGWVAIGVSDRTSLVQSINRRNSITVLEGTGEAVQIEALRQALVEGLTYLAQSPDEFLASMHDEVARLREVLGPG